MTTRSEAFLVLENWRDRQATVLCAGSLFGWNFNLRGKITKLTEEKFVLTSPEGIGDLIVDMAVDGLVFDAKRIGDVAHSERFSKTVRDGAGLTIGLPFCARLSPEGDAMVDAQRERLHLIELPERVM